VDDFDMAKASLLKLQAFERFLSAHPEWRDKVVLVQGPLLPAANCCSDQP
jgi:trehalose-6-phosphate synthase